MVKSIQQLSLQAIYPAVPSKINLNTCGDPDCGNYGLAPDFSLPVFRGLDARARKQLAATERPALAMGRGSYKLNGSAKNNRISDAFEYAEEPVRWEDGRAMVCEHQHGNGQCGVSFNVLSNQHLLDEEDRLQTINGLLSGPACGACGVRYLEHPDEFVFNGTHGTLKAGGNRRKAKPSAFRIIHRPCKGKPGARKSVSLDHQAQQVQRDNVRILRALVNGASINDLRRLLADPDTGKQIGVSRVYSRIFWLEKTLLAFERAKLREWKDGVEASGRYSHMRIAHDDVTISVNWESRTDRRLTPLLFSVSADIRSGYVFRIDANFDPRVDAVDLVERSYLDEDGQPINIRNTYTQASGKTFTAPLLGFQRPTGRFDEAMLFASAEGSWRVFTDRLEKAYEDQTSLGLVLPPEVQERLDHATARRALLDDLRHRYFGFQETSRDHRSSFKGGLVKPTYTKAAHLACLRDMLPAGKITLVGEQEAAMLRVVPHVFRDMIAEDRFEWFVISFDKEASVPKSAARIADFKAGLHRFKASAALPQGASVTDYDLLEQFCAQGLSTAVHTDRQGNASPFCIANFQSSQFPQIWVRSSVQHFGETEKVIGFPVIRSKYRSQMKGMAFDQDIMDPDLRAALSRRVLRSTLQPVSAFMNSLRMRTSPTERAGGKGARNGPAYINGAVFNPAVLIALLNIYRVYYNWFEARQYVGPGAKGGSSMVVDRGASSIRVPGSSETIPVPKRRTTAPILRTPAMRLGADVPKAGSKSPQAPDPRRVLYRPWLYHDTPLWRKFETR